VRIYLDHNATTPLRDEVLEEMARVLRDCHGNPSSVHAEGEAARAVVDAAREQVAALLGAAPGEVLFTAGATEANNTALLGLLRAGGDGRRRQLVSSNVEHPSVEAPLQTLERAGFRVTRLPVDGEGLLDPDRVAEALGPETALLSLLWANNETGAIQPLREIAGWARARGVPVHADATQAVGKIPVDLRQLPLDLLSLSAHKLNGPKGVGALWVRDGRAVEPLLQGGPQERQRRGGTENVAGIAGLGVACELARRELPERQRAWAALRDRLWEGIRARIPRVARNGSAQHALCNTLNVAFEGAAGEVLLQALDLEGVAVSAGAACASGSVEPSPVLLAMGLPPGRARGSLRLSVGHGVDAAQIDRVLELLPPLVERARARRAA